MAVPSLRINTVKEQFGIPTRPYGKSCWAALKKSSLLRFGARSSISTVIERRLSIERIFVSPRNFIAYEYVRMYVAGPGPGMLDRFPHN